MWAAFSPDMADVGGEYLDALRIVQASKLGRDPEAAARLWAHTEELLARLAG